MKTLQLDDDQYLILKRLAEEHRFDILRCLRWEGKPSERRRLIKEFNLISTTFDLEKYDDIFKYHLIFKH